MKLKTATIKLNNNVMKFCNYCYCVRTQRFALMLMQRVHFLFRYTYVVVCIFVLNHFSEEKKFFFLKFILQSESFVFIGFFFFLMFCFVLKSAQVAIFVIVFLPRTLDNTLLQCCQAAAAAEVLSIIFIDEFVFAHNIV